MPETDIHDIRALTMTGSIRIVKPDAEPAAPDADRAATTGTPTDPTPRRARRH